jgi:hypothetical protein
MNGGEISATIPVFIQQGCDVLANAIERNSIERDASNDGDDIIRHFGGSSAINGTIDHISPELLRRVKFGLCENVENEMVSLRLM